MNAIAEMASGMIFIVTPNVTVQQAERAGEARLR